MEMVKIMVFNRGAGCLLVQRYKQSFSYSAVFQTHNLLRLLVHHIPRIVGTEGKGKRKYKDYHKIKGDIFCPK
jgi:hypothetical protein